MLRAQLHHLYKRQFVSTSPLLRCIVKQNTMTTVPQLNIKNKKGVESTPLLGEEVQNRYNILFFCNSNNSLTQRAYLELTTRGHRVQIVENPSQETMIHWTQRENPDIIVCPFLTKRVPPQLYNRSSQSAPCWIVHPGIMGDRGMHSIDWALRDQLPEWGVTILQAADEMDSGDISSTATFPIRRQATKSSLYQNEIVQAAIRALLQAVDHFGHGIPPRPLDYDQSDVKGFFRPQMVWDDRLVDWKTMSAQAIANIVRMSDSQPGAIMYTENTAHGAKIRRLIYGAHVEKSSSIIDNKRPHAKAGDIIAKRNGAVLFKTIDNQGVWISHMKASHGKEFIKLPATSVLSPCELEGVEEIPPNIQYYPYGQRPSTFQEIWMNRQGHVAYIHFEFYNGAMSTEQCLRLRQVIRRCGQDQFIHTIVLCGGYNYFSNGINLNIIEASKDPTVESWRNINAIDDVIKEIFSIRDKVVISALQGNAGAGGVMMALAADLVWSHDSVILNPHYKSMGLFGSEYYTYFLPKRVGQEKAKQITDNVVPMLARQAVKIGMFDKLIAKDHDHFDQMLQVEVNKLIQDDQQMQNLLDNKRKLMTDDWFRLLHKHRNYELDQMKQCFKSQEYIEARQKFVYH